MAKLSLINRQKKREKLVEKFAAKRAELQAVIADMSKSHEEHLQARGMKLPVEFESHQLATVGRMVASGLGVSAVPALCAEQMQELGARCLTLNDSVERAIGVLTEPGNELSAAAQALFDILRAEH